MSGLEEDEEELQASQGAGNEISARKASITSLEKLEQEE
jgi:hypothetical protein